MKFENIKFEKPIFEKLGKEEKILSGFSEKEQEEIRRKQKILSSLAYFIGKDFQIPVELNEPGKGWHWDFKENKIRIDPKDLLEKPEDYLRFVISHEGGHRRISRTEFIPLEVWRQPGFSFMMNAIEDPRDNNFVAENYPKFKEQMDLAYALDLDLENKAKEKAKEKLGYQPKFMQVGFEYIKQWFYKAKGEKLTISEDLPEDVKEVVAKTLAFAEDSWLTYPSRKEADSGGILPNGEKADNETIIKEYAKASYEINRNKIWPEFKKLVEKDMENQKMQEFLKDMERQKGVEKKEEYMPADLDSLSPEEKEKLKQDFDSLPEEKKRELQEKAEKAFKDFEKEINEEVGGKLSDNPEKKEAREKLEKEISGGEKEKSKEQEQKEAPQKPKEEPKELKDYRELIQKTLEKDANIYEKYRREVLPIIDKLENDLREIFVARRANKWLSGFKTGKRIDIKKRIQEKAKGVPAIESKAWQKRELPQEKDYAISLLIDLSGSMEGEKIKETFKATIILAEALNRLSIKTEILGFNDRIYEYQKYGDQMSRSVRENMGGMLKEVGSSRSAYNDDGWALEQASERLERQKAEEKFLIVLSDGQPEESPQHSGSRYDPHKIIEKVAKETNQKLIGLGIGRGTKHVEEYYPNSLADVPMEEMAGKLADIIREAIENYDKF